MRKNCSTATIRRSAPTSCSASASRCSPARQLQAVDETLAWLLEDEGSPWRQACRARADICAEITALHRARLNGTPPGEQAWQAAANRACHIACPDGMQAGSENPENLERMVCCMALLDWSPGRSAPQVAWRFALAAGELAAPEIWREHWKDRQFTLWLDVCEHLIGCLAGNRGLWHPADCPVPRTRFSFWRIDHLKFLQALLQSEDSPVGQYRCPRCGPWRT